MATEGAARGQDRPEQEAATRTTDDSTRGTEQEAGRKAKEQIVGKHAKEAKGKESEVTEGEVKRKGKGLAAAPPAEKRVRCAAMKDTLTAMTHAEKGQDPHPATAAVG